MRACRHIGVVESMYGRSSIHDGSKNSLILAIQEGSDDGTGLFYPRVVFFFHFGCTDYSRLSRRSWFEVDDNSIEDLRYVRKRGIATYFLDVKTPKHIISMVKKLNDRDKALFRGSQPCSNALY